MILKPGIHKGVSFADYLKIEAMNNTTLAYFHDSASDAYFHMTHPELDEDTDAMRLGDAVHCAVLEPERFAKQYVKPPVFNNKTNAGKAERDKWAKDHPDHAPITAKEWEEAAALRDAAWASPTAREILEGEGYNEQVIIWNDPVTGVLCKARIDRLKIDWHGYSVIADLKTTRFKATPKSWRSTIAEYWYHQQAAFYRDGLNAVAPYQNDAGEDARRFFNIVITKKMPLKVACFEMSDSSLEEGRAQYRWCLDQLIQCKASGIWPGYPEGVFITDLNKWDYELTQAPN